MTGLRSAALAAVAGATALAGCSASVSVGGGNYDRAKAQRLISKAVTAQVGARVDHVTCPQDADGKKGDRLTCTVVGIDKSQGTATVRFKDDKGNVAVSAPFLHVREAEQAISAKTAAQTGGGQVLVSCPEVVQVVVGRTFHCTAKRGSQTGDVTVVLEDAAGHFRFTVK